MVSLTKIYTRGGDTGETSLGDGNRVKKYDIRVAAYGTVDEANSIIGIARLHSNKRPETILSQVQNDLFDLGADLCTPEGNNRRGGALRINKTQVKRLEDEIDLMNKELSDLSSFVLPGGTPAASYLHLARTVVRRAERLMVELSDKETINPETTKYINRLSDHLFQLARWVNDKGDLDILWIPGKNR